MSKIKTLIVVNNLISQEQAEEAILESGIMIDEVVLLEDSITAVKGRDFAKKYKIGHKVFFPDPLGFGKCAEYITNAIILSTMSLSVSPTDISHVGRSIRMCEVNEIDFYYAKIKPIEKEV